MVTGGDATGGEATPARRRSLADFGYQVAVNVVANGVVACLVYLVAVVSGALPALVVPLLICGGVLIFATVPALDWLASRMARDGFHGLARATGAFTVVGIPASVFVLGVWLLGANGTALVVIGLVLTGFAALLVLEVLLPVWRRYRRGAGR